MYIAVAYHPITHRRARAASRHGEPERLAVLAIVLITEGALIAVMGKHAQREIADWLSDGNNFEDEECYRLLVRMNTAGEPSHKPAWEFQY
jgi:hypothetical protein